MVIRKPYAFIIKHFRLIHLALLACLIFLYSTLKNIYDLYSDLQATNTYSYDGSGIYITKTVYYVIIIALALSGIIYWLFKEKKKPTGLYLALLIYLGALLIVYPYLFSQLKVLQDQVIDIDKLILVKDIALIGYLPSYVFMFICLLRGLGFNLKQFNFSKDIADMKIEDEDSAEFEISVGKNAYKYKRAIRRFFRETKYYIIENKLMFITICTFIVLVLSGFGFYYYQKYLKKLDNTDATSVDGIVYKINYSFITQDDFNGNIIDKDKKYVVVNVTLYNSSLKNKTLDFTKITLANGNLTYYPTTVRNSKFYDMGIPYEKSEVIQPSESLDRTLTFEIPSTTSSKNFVFRVQYEVDNGINNGLVNLYKKFDINAQNVDTDVVTTNLNKGETINVNALGKNEFDLTISNYSIQDIYNDKYVTCYDLTTCKKLSKVITSTKSSTNTMLILDYKATIYEDANFSKRFNTMNKIFANFAAIVYTINGTEYFENINTIENSDVDGKVFISINRRILQADDIKVLVQFRNLDYYVDVTKEIETNETTVDATTVEETNTDTVTTTVAVAN